MSEKQAIKDIKEVTKFPQYIGKEFRENDRLKEGDVFKNGFILRFCNGLLDGQEEPAIETAGHIEYWKAGHPVRIVTDYFDTEILIKDDVVTAINKR